MAKIPFYTTLLVILVVTVILVTVTTREGFRADQELAPRERRYPLIPIQPHIDEC